MKKYGVFIGMFFLVFMIVFTGISLTKNIGKNKKTISKESAEKQLDRLVSNIVPLEAEKVKSPVDYQEIDVAEELPDIKTCKVPVEASSDYFAEIYSSPEKAGTGTDGWLVEMAEEFNRKGIKVNGKTASVQIRNVNSGQAVDYVSSGKAVPDAITPSSSLWIDMLNAKGVKTKTINEKMVGNVAGIVISKKKEKEISEKYGGIDIKSITEAVEAGDIKMGYTNPFASSSGMNYLISTLIRYDSSNPLSEKARNGFLAFQKNIPLVALTTMQMRNAAEKGTLDAFILEYQSYVNDSNISKNYSFKPYGYRHDNPLVMVSGSDKEDILKAFSDYCDKNGKDLAEKYGFNQKDNYKCEYDKISGNILMEAQKMYKDNKDVGQEVIGVFVADTSGSMNGEPITALKESLINSMNYINNNNYIGLVSYSDEVTVELPIAKFDLEQQSYFKGAVERLSPSGSTATFDAICVGLQMLQKEMKTHKNARPMLFVLSDGETNSGYSYREVHDVIDALNIPIYTIGYNANIDALKKISEINEAGSINADTDDIVYQLKLLFNMSF